MAEGVDEDGDDSVEAELVCEDKDSVYMCNGIGSLVQITTSVSKVLRCESDVISMSESKSPFDVGSFDVVKTDFWEDSWSVLSVVGFGGRVGGRLRYGEEVFEDVGGCLEDEAREGEEESVRGQWMRKLSGEESLK